jgi:hypothetical protein
MTVTIMCPLWILYINYIERLQNLGRLTMNAGMHTNNLKHTLFTSHLWQNTSPHSTLKYFLHKLMP